ncbi:putative leucine-rich repeat domain superfamily [Helianthus annuus]|nr:putative leucine-rich repeat domain superfamily [Helianthus annuus]
MQVPESTRPLLRQIEAMQEAIARKADSWDEAERSLNLQLQDAEAKAAAAEEKEHSVNKHLSKTLSRNNVLEAQVLWVGDEALVAIGNGCPLLCHLNVSGCHHIGDTGITAIARGCHRLTYLDVSVLQVTQQKLQMFKKRKNDSYF